MIPMEDQPVMPGPQQFDIKSPLAQFAMNMMLKSMGGGGGAPMPALMPIQMHNQQQPQGALMPQLPQIAPIGKLYG